MKDRKIPGESNVCCAVQRQKKSTDLMFMLVLNETMDQLAMANSVCWYGHVLRREDGHVLRMALDFVVEGQRKKRRLKRTCIKQVEEDSVKVGLRRKDALCRSKWSVDINRIAAGLWRIWPPSFFWMLSDFDIGVSLSLSYIYMLLEN